MPAFHWYEQCYLEALEERGFFHAPTGYVQPWVYLMEIYWPGHGEKQLSTLDLHFVAGHYKHIPTINGAGILTTVMGKYDYKHVVGLHSYRYSISLNFDEGDYQFDNEVGHYEGGRWVASRTAGVSWAADRYRLYAEDVAKSYNYRGEIFECETPEDRGYGVYGT